MPRGGKRPGAGRPTGSKDVLKVTGDQKASLSELAREYTAQALDTLVKVATKGESETARVSAATALLDRGYGRPHQTSDVTVRKVADLTDADLLAAFGRAFGVHVAGSESLGNGAAGREAAPGDSPPFGGKLH